MADPYARTFGAFDAPFADGFAVTPSDSVNFTTNAASLWVGVGGSLVIVTPAGTVLDLGYCQGLVPFAAKRVNATGTSATKIIGGV